MELRIFPRIAAGAAENMAIDACLLLTGAEADCACCRFYDWTEPAVTFGYSQRWDWVQGRLAGFAGACLRRLTGGGIVDHRNDLTYALTVPPGHRCHRLAALSVYRELHQLIADTLAEAGIAAGLAPCPGRCAGAAAAGGVCFQQPEPYDVIDPASGAKLAGAALKRSQAGLLVQGSLARGVMPALDTAAFAAAFSDRAARWLGLPAKAPDGPLPEALLARERARFSSLEWNRRR